MRQLLKLELICLNCKGKIYLLKILTSAVFDVNVMCLTLIARHKYIKGIFLSLY